MRTWVITGASTGIGRGIAEAVLANKEQVVATARDVARLADLVDRYPAAVHAVSYEATEPGSAQALVDEAIARFGAIDVLVCNAGTSLRRSSPRLVRTIRRVPSLPDSPKKRNGLFPLPEPHRLWRRHSCCSYLGGVMLLGQRRRWPERL